MKTIFILFLLVISGCEEKPDRYDLLSGSAWSENPCEKMGTTPGCEKVVTHGTFDYLDCDGKKFSCVPQYCSEADWMNRKTNKNRKARYGHFEYYGYSTYIYISGRLEACREYDFSKDMENEEFRTAGSFIELPCGDGTFARMNQNYEQISPCREI